MRRFPAVRPGPPSSIKSTVVSRIDTLYDDTAIEDVISDSVDFLTASGRNFAVQHVGALSAGTTVDGLIQESSDDINWFNVSGGAFTQVTVANNAQQIIFTRTKRYLRYLATVASTGSPSAVISVSIGEQR